MMHSFVACLVILVQGVNGFYVQESRPTIAALKQRHVLLLASKQPNQNTKSSSFENSCALCLPELEAYYEAHGVLRPSSKELSNRSSQWAHSIKQGNVKFTANYTSRLERLGLLTIKSKPTNSSLIQYSLTPLSTRMTFHERCHLHLPELEAYYEQHGVLRYKSLSISKEASQWAQHIKQGNVMFLGQYAPRLERLGLLTTNSKQNIANGDPIVSFRPASPKTTFQKSARIYLPELEAYYDRHGLLRPTGRDVSKDASNWAQMIKRGQTRFMGMYATRLERLGLLTKHSVQVPGEDRVNYIPTELRPRHAFHARCDLHLPELEAYYETHGVLRHKAKGISKGASSWAHNIKQGTILFKGEYAERLERLGLLTIKSKRQQDKL